MPLCALAGELVHVIDTNTIILTGVTCALVHIILTEIALVTCEQVQNCYGNTHYYKLKFLTI